MPTFLNPKDIYDRIHHFLLLKMEILV